MMTFFLQFLFLGTLFSQALTNATPSFKDHFAQALQSDNPAALASLSELLVSPDELQNLCLGSLKNCMENSRGLKWSQYLKNSTSQKFVSTKTLEVKVTKPQTPLAIVVVPGVFAEFIKTRAFEEVLQKPSAFRDQAVAHIQKQIAKNNGDGLDKVAFLRDQTNPTQRQTKSALLTELFHFGEISLSQDWSVPVILLGTPFASLESLGNNKDQAETFNRRLTKLISILGMQNYDLAFVGYSRGTPLALEMLAQAQNKKLSWEKQIRAVVALGGVIWGSALADEATKNSNAAINKQLKAFQEVASSLQLIPDGADLFTQLRIHQENDSLWLKIVPALLQNGDSSTSFVDQMKGQVELATTSLAIDLQNPAFIVQQMWNELGLNNWFKDYNSNIHRFRYFVHQLLSSVEELSSSSREQWWKSHQLPIENKTFYSLSAVMVDPNDGVAEESLFNNPFSYANHSLDDQMLIKNFNQYRQASGLELNDSQVSAIQSSFLPQWIAKISPQNKSIQTKQLGLLGTHHWGLALQEVNKMKSGVKNGFPRESLLKALALQITQDLQEKK